MRPTAPSQPAAPALQVSDTEREMQQLCASAVDTQLERLEQKLAMVDELAAMLQREREQLERTRNQVFSERLQAAPTHTTPRPPRTPVLCTCTHRRCACYVVAVGEETDAAGQRGTPCARGRSHLCSASRPSHELRVARRRVLSGAGGGEARISGAG